MSTRHRGLSQASSEQINITRFIVEFGELGPEARWDFIGCIIPAAGSGETLKLTVIIVTS